MRSLNAYLEVMKNLAKADIYYSDEAKRQLLDVWRFYIEHVKADLEH